MTDGTDWCGVCAGLSGPNAPIGDHTYTDLADTSNKMVEIDGAPHLEGKPREWAAAGGAVTDAANMTDDALTRAVHRNLDLPSLSAIASEAETRGLPSAKKAADQFRTRFAAAAAAHLQAVNEGPDQEWIDSLNRTNDKFDNRRGSLYDEYADAALTSLGFNQPAGAELAGRIAAHSEFEIRRSTPALHNADAFDAWVDMEISNGGYGSGPHARDRVRGFRDELARIGAVAREDMQPQVAFPG